VNLRVLVRTDLSITKKDSLWHRLKHPATYHADESWRRHFAAWDPNRGRAGDFVFKTRWYGSFPEADATLQSCRAEGRGATL